MIHIKKSCDKMAAGGIFRLIVDDACNEWMRIKMRERITEEEAAKIKAKLSIIANLLTGYYEIRYRDTYFIDITFDKSDKYHAGNIFAQHLSCGLIGLYSRYNDRRIAIDTVDNIIEKVFIHHLCKEKL